MDTFQTKKEIGGWKILSCKTKITSGQRYFEINVGLAYFTIHEQKCGYPGYEKDQEKYD